MSITPIHEALLTDAMRLVVDFSESSRISIPEMIEAARLNLTGFTADAWIASPPPEEAGGALETNIPWSAFVILRYAGHGCPTSYHVVNGANKA